MKDIMDENEDKRENILKDTDNIVDSNSTNNRFWNKSNEWNREYGILREKNEGKLPEKREP